MKENFVSRFDVVNTSINPNNPLSVGNGNFCFTCDITGLQTLKEEYNVIPLTTMTNRIWAGHVVEEELELTEYKTLSGKRIGYMTDSKKNEELYNALRTNFHKFNLFALKFYYKNKILDKELITEINQRLDLYHGEIISRFKYNDILITVSTTISQKSDYLKIAVESELLKTGLDVRMIYRNPDYSISGENDTKSGLFSTISGNCITRFTKNVKYDVFFKTNGENPSIEDDDIVFSVNSEKLVLDFALSNSFVPSGTDFQEYWEKTKPINQMNYELERRTVLSLYLLKINSLGIFPPAETGLTVNSWYGKFHMEMYLIQMLGLIKFGHSDLVLNSLKYYLDIYKLAKVRAIKQGYEGARWPKMTDPNGLDSPSNIGTLLVWEQPHLIVLVNAIYEETNNIEILKKYSSLINDTLKFMESFLVKIDDKFYLDKPLLAMQECYPVDIVDSPIFEVEYFRYTFILGSKLLNKLDIRNNYLEISRKLVEPNQKDGVYMPMQNDTDCYKDYNYDHPMVIGAYSYFVSPKLDPVIMKNTLDKVLECWDYDELWGWDFPMLALTCFNLGEIELGKEILLKPSSKNIYLKNGHNMQGSRKDLPVYLPGNGLFLLAIYEYNQKMIN